MTKPIDPVKIQKSVADLRLSSPPKFRSRCIRMPIDSIDCSCRSFFVCGDLGHVYTYARHVTRTHVQLDSLSYSHWIVEMCGTTCHYTCRIVVVRFYPSSHRRRLCQGPQVEWGQYLIFRVVPCKSDVPNSASGYKLKSLLSQLILNETAVMRLKALLKELCHYKIE